MLAGLLAVQELRKGRTRMTVFSKTHCKTQFIRLLGRDFKVMKNGVYYCDSISGYCVIQDFDLCKSEDNVDTKKMM